MSRKKLFISAILCGFYISCFGVGPLDEAKTEASEVTIKQNQQQEITFSIGSYSADAIVVDGKRYVYSNLAKQLFTVANQPVLKGAEITAVIKGNTIIRVQSVKLNQAGTAQKSLVFDTPVNLETLIVSASYIDIKNMTVKKQVVVTDKAAGRIELERVHIIRELVVAAQASKETAKQVDIRFNKSTVRLVVVERDAVQLNSSRKIPGVVIAGEVKSLLLNAPVAKLTLENSPQFTLNGTTSVQNIQVLSKTKLLLNHVGAARYVMLYDRKAQLQLTNRVRVGSLEVPHSSQMSQILQNMAWSQQFVDKVVVGGTVWQEAEPDAVVSLQISSLPRKTQYASNENSLDLTGLTLLAHSKKGVVSAVTNYQVSAIDFTKLGQQHVTLSYGGQTASFIITIKAPNFVAYTATTAVTGLPADVTYQNGRFIFTNYAGTSFTFKDGTLTKKVELVKGHWTITTVK